MRETVERLKAKWREDKKFRIGVIIGAVVLIAVIGQCSERVPGDVAIPDVPKIGRD